MSKMDEQNFTIPGVGNPLHEDFGKLIEEAPDGVGKVVGLMEGGREIWSSTMVPKIYRPEWRRPSDKKWRENFRDLLSAVRNGGIVGMIGGRGVGKTRLAAEVVRDLNRENAFYTTAMDFFLRIRKTYKNRQGESEWDVVEEISRCPLLIFDELQVRGDKPWEDDLITHVVDKRYGAGLPAILIANLTEEKLMDSVGASIESRISHKGGIIEVKDIDHRSSGHE